MSKLERIRNMEPSVMKYLNWLFNVFQNEQ
jgi:hypothetical protein